MKKASVIIVTLVCVLLLVVAIRFLRPDTTSDYPSDTTPDTTADTSPDTPADNMPESRILNQTMQVVKLNESGNEVGTSEITMQGKWTNNPTGDDSLELYIDPFDGLGSIVQADNGKGGTSPVHTIGEDYLCTGFGVYNGNTNSMDAMMVYFSKDFEYWAFYIFNANGSVFYVGSASGERTTQEIIQFFGGLVPGYQPS